MLALAAVLPLNGLAANPNNGLSRAFTPEGLVFNQGDCGASSPRLKAMA